MIIISSDNLKSVDIGSPDTLLSVYSTVLVLLKRKRKQIELATNFLNNGCCESSKAMKCAREINLIRDFLASFPPEKAVWNYKDRNRKAPWEGNLSEVITSCANLYTTSDGKDLLYELVAVLVYAGFKGCSVYSLP